MNPKLLTMPQVSWRAVGSIRTHISCLYEYAWMYSFPGDMELGDTLRELEILLSYDPGVLNTGEQHMYPIALIRMHLET